MFLFRQRISIFVQRFENTVLTEITLCRGISGCDRYRTIYHRNLIAIDAEFLKGARGNRLGFISLLCYSDFPASGALLKQLSSNQTVAPLAELKKCSVYVRTIT